MTVTKRAPRKPKAGSAEAFAAPVPEPVTEAAAPEDTVGEIAQECVDLIRAGVYDVGAAIIGIMAGNGRVVVKIAGDHKQLTNLLNITATQHRRTQLAAEYDTLTKALEKYGLK